MITYLKKLREEIKKFNQLTKDISTKNTESNYLLTIIYNKLQDFLEQLNKEKEEHFKKMQNEYQTYSKQLMDTIKNPLNTFHSIDLIPENINLNNYYEPQLIRKDWTQIDTLTDDGGIEVDINFTIMAVGYPYIVFFLHLVWD